MTDRIDRKAVYTIIEREGKKPQWVRIGIAFVNRDASLTVHLDAYPVNGKLHIREFSTRDESPSAGADDR